MKAGRRGLARAVVLTLLTAGASPAKAAETRAYDVVVYGGTAAGVITAVAAARDGARVALLEPRDHLGGMVSGGLGYTDHGRRTVIGGYSLEYYERAGRKYGVPVQWLLEPHVAEGLFQDMVKETGVEVLYRHRLREGKGVTKEGTRIASIALENGSRFAAKVFADATYEGDLMAQAAVSYTWGREGTEQYGESLAGVREKTPYHQFEVPIPARDGKGRPWPEVSAEKRAAPGSGDKKVQAYNFRVCMTQVAHNRVPFPRPARYDARRFSLLAEMLSRTDAIKRAAAAAGEVAAPESRDPKVRLKQPWSLRDVMAPGLLPNGKTDTNNNGAFSTDYVGASYDYPNGSYATRARVWQAHADYVQGFLFFLQNDPQVPAGLREVMAPWGLCKDEFVDSAHWPHQLYVREGRRMIGEYVMSQKDIQTEITKPDVIGMGSYASDSHNVQRIVGAEGYVENEGDMQVPVKPYQIPYRLMLPRRTEATNLLVPVCFSATHVAYSTLRMEPQYMIIGQAAGVAARMAIEKDIAVQDVDTAALAARLRAQRAVMDQPLVPNPTLGETAAAAAGADLPATPSPSPAAVVATGRRLRWVVETSAQPGARPIEALRPDSWREGERLPVVYVLPVEKDDGRRFGCGLDEVARLDLHNRHHVIAVAPTFAQAPWYGDHAQDPATQQERYLVQDVVPSVDRHLPTLVAPASRLLVGFSKSGWGAFTLVLRHPETFGGAAAWDAPLMMEKLGRWETSEIFGTEDAFARFRVDRLLRERGVAVGASRRLVLMGHGRFGEDVRAAHALMEALAVRHQYRDGPVREHRWDSGWLEEAFALLLAVPPS